MSLVRLANPVLAKPKLRLMLEFDLPGGTLKASSDDIYPAGATLDGLYERLVTDKVQVNEVDGDLDPFGGTTTLSVTLPNPRTTEHPNGRFSPWFAVDPRGSLVRAHLYDVETAEERLAEFSGRIIKFSESPGRLQVECATFVQRKLNKPTMTRLVEQGDWPAAPANPLGLGARFSRGYGIGVRVPFCWVRAPTDADPTPYFDYAVEGTVSAQDVRSGDSNQFSAAFIEGEDFTTLDVLVDDVPYTVLRFTHLPLGIVTGNVQRLGFDHSADSLARFPWTSFRDTVGGLRMVPGTHAHLGTSDITTGQLVAGPTEAGLGAIMLGGAQTAPYLTVADADLLAVQTFTVTFPLYIATGADGPLLVSPLSTTDGGSATRHGWALEVESATLKLYAHFGGGSYTLVGTTSALPHGWTFVTIVRDGTAGRWRLYLDRTEALNVLDTSGPLTINYGGTDPLIIGAWKAGGVVDYINRVLLGDLRFTGVAYTAAQAEESVDRWRRNPLPWMAEVFGRVGETVDVTTRAASVTALDTAAGGALACDHWVTDPAVSHRDVLFAVAQMRSMRFGRTNAGDVTIVVPIEAPNAVGTFGMGKGTIGNASFILREVGELGAAMRTLPVIYRPLRDAAGQLALMLGPIRGQVLVIPNDDADDDDGPVFSLPCVYAHRTADQVRDWLCKYFRRRDKALVFEAGTESRHVKRGDVVHLEFAGLTSTGHYSGADYDPEGYVTETTEEADWEVRARRLAGPARRGFTCMPYDETQFQYDAQTLLVDPVVDKSAELQLGNATTIRVIKIDYDRAGQRSIHVRLELLHSEELLPVAMDPTGSPYNLGTVTGAPTVLDALKDESDASYVSLSFPTVPVPAFEAAAFAKSAGARGRLTRLRYVARARLASGGATAVYPGYLYGYAIGGGAVWNAPAILPANEYTLTGSFTDYAFDAATFALNPFTNKPWTAGELRSNAGTVASGELRVAAAFAGPSGATVELSRLAVHITAEQDQPDDFGGIKWFAKSMDPDQDTFYEMPAEPIEGVDPSSPLTPNFDYTFTEEVLTLPGQYAVWAFVYDGLGRLAEIVGPVATAAVE